MLKLFKQMGKYYVSIIFALVFVFLQSIAELNLPMYMKNIVDVGIAGMDTNYIVKNGIIMVSIAILSMVCTVISSYISAKISAGFGRDLRNKVFRHATQFSLWEFDEFTTSSMITRTTNDIQQVQNVVYMILRMVVTAPIMAVGGIIMAVNTDVGLSKVLLVSLPILFLCIILISTRTMPLFKKMQKNLDKLNSVIREGLTGIRVIRAFNRDETQKGKFKGANTDLTEVSILAHRMMSAMMPALQLTLNMTTIAIVWMGARRVSEMQIEVGSIMAFIQYITLILMSFVMLSMMFVMLPRAAASAERINEVLETEVPKNDSQMDAIKNDKKGYISMNNVSFKYPGAECESLKNITFEAKPGETTAIIGGTGSGKSTLINLMLRFYDASSGEIKIDDVDISKYSEHGLREKIGYAPQKALLFSGTVFENIAYGKQDATLEEIKHAAVIAQADEFIGAMPEGYDSYIAQGGQNVSGGQKQRLSIARAIVRKPEIYIFDDSFSALDFKTDRKLREALKPETRNSTVILVAQRITTVMDADRIIVMDDGKIAGIGKHADLLKSCEVYKEIAYSQLSEEEISEVK